ncbi:Astacin (Peptidase M12A) [Parelaphostrongylus tenuis]|uniref:Astacin (Peptidase M12A) n=1 Tax=Parelaphostrongylus tenuis TaxID=148309 RepID=A0AAD5MTW8_PARTN|nr:Astacin (Peptidase M12A) [Parelaphostrongylus tenuis]
MAVQRLCARTVDFRIPGTALNAFVQADMEPSGCGKVLTATTSFQFFEHVGQKNASVESNGYAMCNYWIEAPAGSKIEVVLDYFSRGFSNDGCVHAAVEIKTENDKRLTGYRFCGRESIGTSLTSTHNIAPIITYSDGREAITELRYRIASDTPEISK